MMKETKTLKRLRRKLGIEVLWLFILSVLYNGDSYAYEISKKIKDRFGFDPGRVLPYIVLKKLVSGGFVESYISGRRVYYRITSKGEREFLEGVSYIKEILEKLTKPIKSAMYTSPRHEGRTY